MILAVALILAQPEAAGERRTVDLMLDAALQFDAEAYNQICGRSSAKQRFKALQARAARLNERYNQRFLPQDIVSRYVDRRAVGVCFNPRSFVQTADKWSASLDAIDHELGGRN